MGEIKMVKSKTKSILILLVTLILGIVIGFQINEILIKKRFEEMRAARRPGSFIKLFENILQPSEEQKVLLEPIFIKYQQKIDEVISNSRVQVDAQMDSLTNDLKPILKQDQLDRFTAEIKNVRKGPPLPPHNQPFIK
jgi:hypothetical protein